MADNYRECPHCGGLTKELTCEICGRRTILTNQIYEDDQPSNKQTQNSTNYKEVKPLHTPAGHIQTMLEEGRNYGKTMPRKTNPSNAVWIRLGVVLAIIIPLIISLFVNLQRDETDNSYNDYDDYDDYDDFYEATNKQYHYLQDYLVRVQSDAPLICTIDEEDKDWFYIYNETPYLYDADIEIDTIKGMENTTLSSGIPYGYESSISENEAKSCKATATAYYDLNLYKTSVVYAITYDDDFIRTIKLSQPISDTELETLLKRIYCINILTYYDFEEEMHVRVNDKHAYNVTFTYGIGDIQITDMDSGRSYHITVDI